METTIKAGTYVICAGKLGTVVRESRHGHATGYDVQSYYPQPGDGIYPHFVDSFYVKAAVVGQNVCREPRGTHWCGLTHVDAQILAKLPRSES